MKCLFFMVLFTCNLLSSNAQKQEQVQESVDTTSKTSIEKMFRQTSIVKKVEFVEIDKVKVIHFQIIIITNLKTGVKTKGLYLSNQSVVDFWKGDRVGERHAYLDENEIDDLITFLDNCDSKWKNQKPDLMTQYHFETLDNLRIVFWTKQFSNSWNYEIQFSNYKLDNRIVFGKSQSDELLNALKEVKTEIGYF